MSIMEAVEMTVESGRLLDMSRGVLRVITPANFRAGNLLVMKIRLVEENKQIIGLAEVMWNREAKCFKSWNVPWFLLGVDFIQLDGPKRSWMPELVGENVEVRNKR